MTTRKKYPKEFKLDEVSLVLEQEYTKAEASRSLGINHNLIARWIQEHQEDESGQAFRCNGKLTPELEEIRALRAQVKRLQMEKDILKKATVGSIGQCNSYPNRLNYSGDQNETNIFTARERPCF
jgi:transposase